MSAIAQCEQDTSKHPDVHFTRDLFPTVHICQFRGSVHHCCRLFNFSSTSVSLLADSFHKSMNLSLQDPKSHSFYVFPAIRMFSILMSLWMIPTLCIYPIALSLRPLFEYLSLNQFYVYSNASINDLSAKSNNITTSVYPLLLIYLRVNYCFSNSIIHQFQFYFSIYDNIWWFQIAMNNWLSFLVQITNGFRQMKA